MTLKGKVFIITGGASGFGETLARYFVVEKGRSVDINKEFGLQIEAELNARNTIGYSLFKKRGGGAVVNTASVTGLYPLIVPRMPVYTAAKAAIIAFSQVLEPLKDEENICVMLFAILCW
ncbi:4151_t:CDS:2 [Ambispora gerdemannii]|uniref:4151_t:CDS:1 n=1 Tax=Ambispora gerdemannii TaxID=144530 RepID=A0A9N9B6K5_9GLOM|nr:4151_t:CDS:2 [Ambispora gerdemannii]